MSETRNETQTSGETMCSDVIVKMVEIHHPKTNFSTHLLLYRFGDVMGDKAVGRIGWTVDRMRDDYPLSRGKWNVWDTPGQCAIHADAILTQDGWLVDNSNSVFDN